MRTWLGVEHLKVPEPIGRLYECFIFTLFARALTRTHDLEPRDAQGRTARFRFRETPAGLQVGCYLLATHRGTHHRLELHNGLQVKGRSRQAHEVDVGLYDESQLPRIRKGAAPRAALLLGIECRCRREVSLAEARGVVGLAQELDPVHFRLVAGSNGSSGVAKLLQFYRIAFTPNVAPGAASNLLLSDLVLEIAWVSRFLDN